MDFFFFKQLNEFKLIIFIRCNKSINIKVEFSLNFLNMCQVYV